MSRQKLVFPRDTVAHLWAHAAQDEARDPSGNMYFTGPALYSYGRHYVIGYRYAENEAAPLYIMNADSNSPTTNKMRNLAHRALPSYNGAAWVGGLKSDSFAGHKWRAGLMREALTQAGELFEEAANVSRKSRKRDGLKAEAQTRINAARLIADYVIAAGKATGAEDKKAARVTLKSADAAAAAMVGYADADNAGQIAALTAAAALTIRDKQRAAMLEYAKRADGYAGRFGNPDGARWSTPEHLARLAADCAAAVDRARGIAKRYGFRAPAMPDGAAMVKEAAPALQVYRLESLKSLARATLQDMERARRSDPDSYRLSNGLQTIREAARTARDYDAPETVPAWMVERAETISRAAQRRRDSAQAENDIKHAVSRLESGDSYADAGHARDAAREYRGALACFANASTLPATHPAMRQLRALDCERARIAAWLADADARMLAENAASIAAWRETGARLPHGVYGMAVMLRLAGNNVETSHGASVPVAVAPVLWRAVTAARAGKADEVTARYRGRKIGHYALQTIRPDGSVLIGCHDIPFTELAGIAATLGYSAAGASVPA